MENTKVQALYSFSGEPGSAELSISVGEILTVTRQDVGDGWWEGINQNGETGLFPAAYVEVCGDQAVDYWDEDWDEEYDTNIPPPPPVTYPIENDSQAKSQAEPVRTDESSQQVLGRKHFNRYSSFGENYILNESTKAVPDSEKMIIVETENGVMWSPVTHPYSCIVTSPKKETKLKGLKSFIAYQITPSFNNIQVSRRYKHFDWLHERLEEKYSLIPIPPLPDKQIAGRYEEQFIEHRKNQLQAFVDAVCRHPILSRSPVWEHFITCTDDKMWKTGKRRAEKDEFVGAANFYSIEAPNKSINPYVLEQEAISYSKFVHNMDSAVKLLLETASDQMKKHVGLYKREYQKIGQAFFSLGHAMSCEFPKGHENLTATINTIGDTYNDIGRMFEDQPKLDWEPLGDMLHIYKGLLASIPDILSLHKRLLFKKKEYEKRAFEQKMTPAYIEGISKRTDALSYAILAEMNHFYTDRAEEVSKALKNHLQQQLEFYKKVTEKLEHAVSSFEA